MQRNARELLERIRRSLRPKRAPRRRRRVFPSPSSLPLTLPQTRIRPCPSSGCGGILPCSAVLEIERDALFHVPHVHADAVFLDCWPDGGRLVSEETPFERGEPPVLLYFRGTGLASESAPVVFLEETEDNIPALAVGR